MGSSGFSIICKQMFSFPCLKGEARRFYNVILLGLGFCFTFAGFNTMGGIQTLVFESAKNENSGGYVEGFNGSGLWSLAIIYMTFTLGNILAPTVVTAIGPRATLVLGSLAYTFYILQMLILNNELLYFASVVAGIGQALYWNAQGNFLSINSDESTIGRNSGIFWAMFASSGIVGNVIVYTQFRGKEFIDTETRTAVGVVVLCLGGVATLILLLTAPTNQDVNNKHNTPAKKTTIQVLKTSGKLLMTRDMALLAFTFLSSGIQLNIWSALYNTCLGFTSNFGDQRKGLAVISGIFVALGSVLAGGVLSILGQCYPIRKKSPIIILGFIMSITAYILMFINIPKDAPFGETDVEKHISFIEPNKYVAILASFSIGIADAIYNIQIISLCGDVYKEDSASAFAIFRFFQVGATSIAFWYSPVINLYYQLLIATVLCCLGSTSFIVVEVLNNKNKRSVDEKKYVHENPVFQEF